jgi:stage III sporulation protein AD
MDDMFIIQGEKMDIVKIVGIGIIAVIIITIIKQYKPEFAIYVSILAGIIIFFMVFENLSGIIDLINDLTLKSNVNSDFIKILLKITGIAFLAEFAVQICMDLGESALANKVDLGGKVIIISLSIPILSSLIETVVQILP